MSKLLGLPAVPPSLKSIAAYISRAEEVYQKEPTVAYWCVYHATQTGIAAKLTKDAASRDFLSQLLTTLERMKTEIGPNDAVDLESASAAYVENFALKVFAIADNEDRRGQSTKATAKKFFAAANFLEVLQTFPQTETSDSIEGKAKYAKWKAFDISKALKEGRTPRPGPAEGESEPDLMPGIELPSAPPLDTLAANHAPPLDSPPSGGHSTSSGSPKRYSPPAIKRSSPPPVLDDLPSPNHITPPRPHFGLEDPSGISSPGSWSTAATPGTTTVSGTPMEGFDGVESQGGPFAGTKHDRNASDSSSSTLGGQGDRSSPKRVHFAPSAPPPPPVIPSPPAASFNSSILGYPTPPTVPTHPHHHASPPPPPPPAPPTSSQPASQPPLPRHEREVSRPAAPPVLSPEVELTPGIIAKTQKHCRFAISALDYEDAAQARKELRAALALLGG